jgi:cytochrome P450
MVLQESMRLYPPVWFIARKSVVAGDIKGCHVPGNMAVIVSPYAIHRHPGFWEEPDAFNPLRFEQISSRPKFSYIPFGGGHHQCLGMHLALVEAQLILASVAREFKIQPLAGHAIVPQPAITLRQRDGLLATLARRRKGG